MRLKVGSFDRFLTGIGQVVLWRRSWSCACASRESGAADPSHALCGGKGRIWADPVETITGIASQAVQAKWAEMGMWEAGDMVLSVPQSSPLWDAGQFDRVTSLNGTDVFSRPMTRGAASERLNFKVSKLTRCFWLHPTTRLPVDGSLPVVGDDGRLSWPGGVGEPPGGVTYSLTGEKYVEYFLWGDMPSDRNQHQGARLPKKMIARRFDLFSR